MRTGILSQLVQQGYYIAIVTAIIAIIISYVIANAISYQPGGNDRSYIKRRVSYFLTLFVAAMGYAGYFIYKFSDITNKLKDMTPKQEDELIMGGWLSLGLLISLYIVISIAMMLVFKKSKYGTILKK